MQKMVTSISENLAASKMFFTPTTGSFLRIIFDLDAPISASLVKIVSSKSHNHHIGIAILEKQLAFGDGTERRKHLDAILQLYTLLHR
jgi:DNA-dependent protein kinase catalytic subunit